MEIVSVFKSTHKTVFTYVVHTRLHVQMYIQIEYIRFTFLVLELGRVNKGYFHQ